MSHMSNTYQRQDNRAVNELRNISFQNNIAPYATGSTLIEWGDTRVICGVSVEESVPRWMQDQDGGWITAEYSMLPYSTLDRKKRDVNRGKLDGRSTEIQRLIGRSMRSAIDLKKVGGKIQQTKIKFVSKRIQKSGSRKKSEGATRNRRISSRPN